MIEIGKENTLTILRASDPGIYLIDEDGEEVLLPNKYVPENYRKGEEIEVFIYKDSEDRLVATTLTPLAKVGDFAHLKVKAINSFGAFLDWGLEKDLMAPFKEQGQKMQVGQSYMVYVYLDSITKRLVATGKYDKYVSKEHDDLNEGQEVDILIAEKSELGYRAIFDNNYLGLIYSNEIFKAIQPGSTTRGYIKRIREDGKIDLSLERSGYDGIEPQAMKILNLLKENDGYLKMNDKSSPEEIKNQLEMSKKVFKKAIGQLYKQKIITIENEGIRIND